MERGQKFLAASLFAAKIFQKSRDYFAMTMPNEIKNKLIRAYNSLLKNDGHLLIVEANERSITHKFAEYIQMEFPEYNVDCEYNRNLYGEKTVPIWEARTDKLISELLQPKTTAGQKARIIQKMLDGEVSVYPDIIVHHRGTKDNFVVIEAKKSTNIENDEEKLLAYKDKDGLYYKHAFAVLFLVGKDFPQYNSTALEDLINEK